ncbi:glycoside hydrolase [Priestia megaterium]|uniref:glycosyltransferase family 4 protein n=1 Tax=Priestia megaterium TaxID=1404 RepID=UPI000E12748C|nr:glycosyltransferase family 4 protein [Priestia megaterium]SUV02268.1 glycoside hydrolase [Priestia megaterium]
MKILVIHNYYQISGGEDRVLEEEIKLLTSNGVEVVKYFISNKEMDLKGLVNKIKLGINTVWSKQKYKEIKSLIKEVNPDLVHLHNTFPLLSPSVYYACQVMGKPVVQTLHNYRLGCPGAMLLRNNEVCEKCISGSLLNSVKYGCYRNSRVQTVPLSTMLYTHRFLNTWNNKVDKYIALTNFAKEKFIQIGLNEDKITVKPNFIEKHIEVGIKKEDQVTFVGRISKEKGLHLLLAAWSKVGSKVNTKLNVIGDGPLRKELESKYQHLSNVNFLGKLDSKDVLSYMSKSKYIIVPSIWYEGFPMTIIESYSVNTPVISSNIGSLKEVVINEVTGFHFENNNINSLENTLKKALHYSDYDKLQRNINEQYEKKYTPSANFKMLINIYEEVVRSKKIGK